MSKRGRGRPKCHQLRRPPGEVRAYLLEQLRDAGGNVARVAWEENVSRWWLHHLVTVHGLRAELAAIREERKKNDLLARTSRAFRGGV